LPVNGPQGWREAREVVGYLRKQGAKVTALANEGEGDWAASVALSSGDEGADGQTKVKRESVEWVSPSTH